MKPMYQRPPLPALLTALLLAAGALPPAAAQGDATTCGPLANAYGPFDYRTDKDKLTHVERPHFPPVVEALIRGNRGYLGQDIDYTLRAFPNHHRALLAVMRYGEKLKTPHVKEMPYTVECYFDRALRFRPDDNIVRMLYAQFLAKNERKPEGLKQLEVAAAGAEESGFTQYNIGMIYVEMKEFDRALGQAHKAIWLGFERPALREQLVAAGKWVDAPPAPEKTAAAAAPDKTDKAASATPAEAPASGAPPAAVPR